MQLESDQGHHVELPITRVHHVDGIPDDIVSLARLVQESSYSFHATPEGSFLEAPDNSQIPVMIEDGVFVLEDRSKCNFVRSDRKEATLQELHVRLGHASKQCMIDTRLTRYTIRSAYHAISKSWTTFSARRVPSPTQSVRRLLRHETQVRGLQRLAKGFSAILRASTKLHAVDFSITFSMLTRHQTGLQFTCSKRRTRQLPLYLT